MKKLICITTVLALIFLCGCSQNTRLDEKIIIVGVGVDFDGTMYNLTLQTINSHSQNNENSTKLINGCSGSTVLEALDNVTQKTGKTPLLGQNLFIVLSKRVCMEGVTGTLDFFTKFYESRPTVGILVSEGSAEAVLKNTDPNEAAQISQLQENSGNILKSNLLEFISDSLNETSDPKAPLLKVEDKVIKADGTAFFYGDKYKGTLSNDETLGASLVMGRCKNAAYKTSSDAFRIKSSDSRITATEKNGRLRFYIDIDADIELSGSGFDLKSQSANSEISKALEKTAYSALKRTAIENGCDIFELGKILLRQQPQVYKNIADFSEKLMNAEYMITVITSFV